MPAGRPTSGTRCAITAQEKGNRTLAGSAIAHGDIDANGNVTFGGDVLVQADALGGVAAANVDGARLPGCGGGQDAEPRQQGGSDGQRPCRELRHQGRHRRRLAHLQGNAIHEAVANGQGDVAITASALGLGHNIDDAIAVASFTADADVGGILFQNNIDVHAKAVDPGTGRMTGAGLCGDRRQ